MPMREAVTVAPRREPITTIWSPTAILVGTTRGPKWVDEVISTVTVWPAVVCTVQLVALIAMTLPRTPWRARRVEEAAGAGDGARVVVVVAAAAAEAGREPEPVVSAPAATPDPSAASTAMGMMTRRRAWYLRESMILRMRSSVRGKCEHCVRSGFGPGEPARIS